MMNSLDLMIIIVLAVVAAGLLTLSLMFLSRNEKLKKVCVYMVAALGLYACSIGFRIGWPYFMGQAVAAIAIGVVAVAAIVLVSIAKDDAKKHKLARILAAASLVLGMVSALM